MDHSEDVESDSEYEVCPLRSNSYALPFDPTSIENVILTISDKFNFRVILSGKRAQGAMIVTSGLAMAGGLIGRHYGGKIGGVVGGAIGGACGLGIVAVSMREVWEDIKVKLFELFDIVYDYLAGMGIEDYKKAATFLIEHNDASTQLAMLVLEMASSILGKKILSSLPAAL